MATRDVHPNWRITLTALEDTLSAVEEMDGDTLIANSFSTSGATATGPLGVGVALQALCAIAGAGIGLALLQWPRSRPPC